MVRQFSNKLIKEFQKNPKYWLGIIVFLTLFLKIGGSLLMNNVISFFIVTALLQLGFKNWKQSAIYALIILFAINLIHYFGYTQEGFDNLDEALKKLEALGNSQHKDDDEDDNKDEDFKTGKDTVNDDNDKEKTDEEKAVPVIKLSGKNTPVEEFNQWNDKEKDKVLKSIVKDTKEVKRPAAVAQRDLYQLIDTVKQLQTTVDQLGPTLKEGKKIMDAFENIKID